MIHRDEKSDVPQAWQVLGGKNDRGESARLGEGGEGAGV